MCAPDDPDCVETGVIKACNEEGACVADTGDLCDEDYEPCAGKTCGDICTICAPDDFDCFETEELKACNEAGECVSFTEDLCDGAYEPCAGKSCGDVCTICPPGDLDCVETTELKACDSEGACVSDTGDLCSGRGSLCDDVNSGYDLIGALGYSGGCGDMTLYAVAPDRTLELNLYIAGVCEEASGLDEPLVRSYALPDSAVSLGINRGQYVDEFTCNDAILNSPVIDEVLVPQSGELILEVRSEGEATAWSTPSFASATLDDVRFMDSDGCTFTLSYTWTDVYVGWLVGK